MVLKLEDIGRAEDEAVHGKKFKYELFWVFCDLQHTS
jgi:hypothetical protein